MTDPENRVPNYMRANWFLTFSVLLILFGRSYAPAHKLQFSARSHSESTTQLQPLPTTSYLRLKKVRIVDATDFSEPVEVMSLLIPSDWKFEGEAKWILENRACPEMENISAITFRISSPDGRTYRERFPNSFWTWATNVLAEDPDHKNPCPFHEPVSPGSYVSDQLLSKVRPGARILSVEPLDEMSRAVMEAVRRGNTTSLYFAQNVNAKVDCARVTYEFPANDHAVRESIIGTIITMIHRKPAGGAREATKYSDYYSIHASDFNASRAPEGQLESSGIIFARIMMSLRTNPRWIAGRKLIASRLSHHAEISEGDLRHNNLPEMTAEEILAAYRKQVEARLPTARTYDPTVLPLRLFVDPQTNEKMELNGGFAFAWSNQHDEYVLTNEEGFNPGTELNGN